MGWDIEPKGEGSVEDNWGQALRSVSGWVGGGFPGVPRTGVVSNKAELLPKLWSGIWNLGEEGGPVCFSNIYLYRTVDIFPCLHI